MHKHHDLDQVARTASRQPQLTDYLSKLGTLLCTRYARPGKTHDTWPGQCDRGDRDLGRVRPRPGTTDCRCAVQAATYAEDAAHTDTASCGHVHTVTETITCSNVDTGLATTTHSHAAADVELETQC